MDSVRSHPFVFRFFCDFNFNHQMENLTPYTISMLIEYILVIDSIFSRQRERIHYFYFLFSRLGAPGLRDDFSIECYYHGLCSSTF